LSTNLPEEKVLAEIGRIILVSQTAERLIDFCMTFVIQKDSPLTIEKLEAQRSAERRKTLGYFLAQLRQRADVAEGFDQLLTRFLEMRNTLVHRVTEIEGWNLSNESGREAAVRFLGELGWLSVQVMKIFMGFIRAWEVQTGTRSPVPPGGEELFAEIDSKYANLIDQLLAEKEE
jgi:hypothetical protein